MSYKIITAEEIEKQDKFYNHMIMVLTDITDKNSSDDLDALAGLLINIKKENIDYFNYEYKEFLISQLIKPYRHLSRTLWSGECATVSGGLSEEIKGELIGKVIKKE